MVQLNSRLSFHGGCYYLLRNVFSLIGCITSVKFRRLVLLISYKLYSALYCHTTRTVCIRLHYIILEIT